MTTERVNKIDRIIARIYDLVIITPEKKQKHLFAAIDALHLARLMATRTSNHTTL